MGIQEYEAFNRSDQECPYCGQLLDHGGLIDWTCDNCGLQFDTVYDSYNKEYALELIVPEICSDCGGPFPDCMSSCGIFDD